MSQPEQPQRPFSPDNALPPVEPPSAGFILQLFVVPGVIVVIIVMVWLMFNWLARTKTDPDSYIAELKRNNAARWQVALNLATALHNEPALRENAELATSLAEILDEEIARGETGENPIRFRSYLCRALGEFDVPDGTPTLLKAIATSHDDKENEVRRSALEAIALRAQNLRQAGDGRFPDENQVHEVLLKASADQEPLVRSAAAFAMGVVGGSDLVTRLEAMLADAYPDARYNAATGLARHGHEAAVEVLLEMLDPENRAGIEIEKETGSQEYKLASVQLNALRATQQLAAANRTANLKPLADAVEKLLAGDIPGQVEIKARETLLELKRRDKAAAQEAAQ